LAEVPEAPAAGGPRIERTLWGGRPHGNLVALAELRGRIAVQPQRLSERGARVGTDRAVPWRRWCDLRHASQPDRVVVGARQQRLPGRRAERGRVEAVELQPIRRQTLRGRRRTGPTEGT